MKHKFLILFFFISIFSGGCSSPQITQVSTIDALLAGVYDGSTSCRKLLDYGDFGIGTFDSLDGEMIILDGKIYQVKSDGKACTPAANIKTPFAAVCYFHPNNEFALNQDADYKSVQLFIDNHVSNQNIFLAIKISGTFQQMKVRSVPAQQKPYPPLVAVTQNQPVFELNNVTGTIVGFRSPPFVKGINVPGYHLHFLTTDRRQGGHILDFKLISGVCKTDTCTQLLLLLPDNDNLKNIDLSKDRTLELEKVEK